MKKKPDDELYVYALVEAGTRRSIRVARRHLEVIAAGGVGAIVEPSRGGRPPDMESLDAQHGLIVDLAGRVGALLPARFGSVISRAALQALISTRTAPILQALEHVRGRSQMTIRVFGVQQSGQERDARPSTGVGYLAARRNRLRAVAPEVAAIRRAVGDVDDERAVAAAPGVLAVYHLISSEEVPRYRKKASTLQGILAPKRVTVSGPWPPFAFAPELF